MIRGLATVCTGRWSRWLVLLVWLGLAAFFAPLSAKINAIKVDSSTSLLPASSEAGQVAETLKQRFDGGDRPATVMLYRRPGGLTSEDKAKILEDAGEAAEVPLAGMPIPAFQPGPADGQLAATPQFVSADGATAFTLVPLATGKSEEVAESVEELREIGGGTPGLEFHLTGAPAILNDINTAVESADIALVVATVLLVLGLLLAIYRSPILAFIPLFVVIVSYIIASGIIYLAAEQGLKVDSTGTSLLLILMFGAGTDYCLLLVARYRDDLHVIQDQKQALRTAMPLAVPAILASGVTVAAALLTLLASQLGTNQTLGPVTAIGVAVVLLASVTLLPVLLGLFGRKGFWPARKQAEYQPHRYAPRPAVRGLPEPEDEDVDYSHPATRAALGVWTRVGVRVLRRPGPALAAGLLLLAACAFGSLAYKPDVNPVKEFRTSPDSKVGIDLFRANFPKGAVNPSTVLVERENAPVTDADVQGVVTKLQGAPGIAAVMPAPDPRSKDGRIARLALLFEDDPFLPATLEGVDEVRATVAQPGEGLKVSIGDGAARFRDHQDAANRDLLVIAPLVLFVIFIVLVILLRAIVAPIFLLATVVLSFLGTFGISTLIFTLFFGRDTIDPLLPILAFIFLVALGVDYNIFLMDRIRHDAGKHGTRRGTLKGLVATGPVITSAGLILAGTFVVLATLPVWLLFQIGFTVALGVLIDTFLVRTVIVPAITAMLDDRSWWPSTAQKAEPYHPFAGSFAPGNPPQH